MNINKLGNMKAFMLPVGAVAMVFVMLIPIPTFLLDLFLAGSIMASLIVFLTAVQIRNHRNPIAKFEYWNGSQWMTVPRVSYNFFVQTNPGMGVSINQALPDPSAISDA